MTLGEIRAEFPHIRQGKIYFNHAAIGPLPNSVKEKVGDYLEVRNSGIINNYMNFLQTAAQTKHILAKLFNTKPGRIGFVQNVAAGMNLIAQGLDFKPGDRIILNDMEFPSNVYPFLKKNIVAEVREGYLRISPHFYNTTDEIDLFINELSKIV